MPNRLRVITDPVEAFIQYFLDTKPYHTKILEVVESYVFNEEMRVDMLEEIFKHVTLENDPLCKFTGFGLVYDDSCGYSAVDCCDLFDCEGTGYGFIFDNSDQLVDAEILGFDPVEGFIQVEGNQTVDVRVPIVDIPASDTIIVKGDQTSLLTVHKLFLNVDITQLEIIDNDAESVFLEGNHVPLLGHRNTFFIIGEESDNNGVYHFSSVTYDSTDNITTLTSSSPLTANMLAGSHLSVKNNAPNAGVLKGDTFQYDSSTDTTIIQLSSSTPLGFTASDIDAYSFGSIQFKTALKYGRVLELEETIAGVQPPQYNILYSVYDANDNSTKVYLPVDLSFLDINVNRVYTYGYFQSNGYGGGEECSSPKRDNIHSTLFETLRIEVVDDIEVICLPIECSREEFCLPLECSREEFCLPLECSREEFCLPLECPREEFCLPLECPREEFCLPIEC